MKRIICLILSIVLCLSGVVYATENAQNFNINDNVTDIIKLCEIATGDQDGNMNYEKLVTRAEFIKMAVMASNQKDNVLETNLNTSMFPDVKNTHWAAGYVNVGVKSGIINGYLDGTFKPDNKVRLEEAATIVLKMLGYTFEDFTGSYPKGQISMYENQDLNVNISAKTGEYMTRNDCFNLFYNLLNAKTKSGSVYCTTLGYALNSNQKIDFNSLLEAKLDDPIVVKDSNNWKSSLPFPYNMNTKVFYNGNVVSSDKIKQYDVVYPCKLLNALVLHTNTYSGIVQSSNMSYSGTSNVTVSGKTYEIKDTELKNKFFSNPDFYNEKSFITLILGKNNEVIDVMAGSVESLDNNSQNPSYSDIVNSSVEGPFIVSADKQMKDLPFNLDEAKIFHSSSQISKSEIQAYDVYYYSAFLKSIWIYRDKVSGIIESLTPVSSPDSVVLSGKTYKVEDSLASFDLSSFGTFGVGSVVTLLLGKDGVAGVVPAESVSGIIYGIVTSVGTKTFTNSNGTSYSGKYVCVTDTASNTYTYEYDYKYFPVGTCVKVNFGKKVSLEKINQKIERGNAATLKLAFAEGRFSPDCEIIDVKGTQFVKVYPSRISGADMDIEMFTMSGIVKFYKLDKNNNIEKLILNNFTGDLQQYGVVTSRTDKTIKYIINGVEKSFQSETMVREGPCTVSVSDNGSVESIIPILSYVESDYLTEYALYDKNDNKYILSEDVQVYYLETDTYKQISLEDAISGNYRYRAYSDKSPSLAGRVRVIVVYRAV